MSESGQNVKKKNTDECLVCSKPPYQSKKISSKLLDFSIKDLLLKYGGISKDKGVICRNCERRLETLHKKTVEFYDECQSAARKDDFTTPVVCNKRLPTSPLVGFHPKRASLEINEDFQQPSQHASSENMFVDLSSNAEPSNKGYANEVGEAFRSMVNVNLVRFTYVVASGYVVADAVHKGQEASQKTYQDEKKKQSRVRTAVLDTLIWQGLASVAIPGFTINRVCTFSGLLLKKSTSWPAPMRHWTTTFIGLACIPFIIKPIDRSVDYFMENSFRKWFQVGPVLKELVHHERND